MLRQARTDGATAVIVDLPDQELQAAGACLRIAPGRPPGVSRLIEATGLDKRLAFIPDGARG